MANGNWTLAAYVDERADEKRDRCAGAIFGGGEAADGRLPAPMVGKRLGVKKVPIKYSMNGKTRSVEIPDIIHLAVEPLPVRTPVVEFGLRLVIRLRPTSSHSAWAAGQLVCRSRADSSGRRNTIFVG